MLRLLALGIALFYSLSWVRIPDISGFALPISRLLGMMGIYYLPQALTYSSTQKGMSKNFFITIIFSTLYIVFSGILIGSNSLESGNAFSFPLFWVEVSKLVAGIGSSGVIYLYLSQRSENITKLINYLGRSMKICLGLTAIFLILFLLKVQMNLDWLAPSKGGYIGIWEQGTVLPRLAGTTAEPQSFAYAFITTILIYLAIAKKNIKDFIWPLIGVSFLLISFSKFSVVSLAFILLFLVIRHKGFGWALLLLAGMAIVPVIDLILDSPVFKQLLEEGSSTAALAERGAMNQILIEQFLDRPLFGIGLGQFSINGRDQIISWLISRNLIEAAQNMVTWKGNMDYLSLLAETGLFGAIPIIASILIFTGKGFVKGWKLFRATGNSMLLAVSLGCLVILCNMAIGYTLLHSLLWINLGIICYFLDNNQLRVTSLNNDGKTIDRLYRAARQGYVDAQHNLGVIYYCGQGVPKDYRKATEWFRKAAQSGFVESAYSLGLMYDKGQGVPHNSVEAYRWYRKAADRGHARAQHNLGVLYHEGQGVPNDNKEAYKWFTLSAANGFDKAVQARDLLSTKIASQ